MDDKTISVLLIEDNPGDARLIREMLAEARGMCFDLECADRLSTGLERLAEGDMDVLLIDLGLPDSQGLDSLVRVQAQAPEVPIVVLSGLDDETLAVQAVEAGAQDYLVKGQVDSNPLARALRYAIERKRIEEERERLVRELEDALAEIRTLRGILPICSYCKKIRDDEGYWHQVEVYIRDRSEVEFSHGICPDCAKKLYPEIFGDDK
jgi:DNA-binding response OmpR family regulator